MIFPIALAMNEINAGLWFDTLNLSLMFAHNYDSYQMLPLPHLNTIPFDHAEKRDYYLTSRRIGGYYVAYDNSRGRFTTWNIINGKKIYGVKIEAPKTETVR